MTRLSQHYRDDAITGLDPAVTRYLDNEYLRHVPNIDRQNPKLLVVFSGGNAMGKTTISRKIQAEYGGLTLENDAIKRCLLRIMPHATRDELSLMTWQYTMNMYGRLPGLTPNGLIVRDGVIDWYFDRILPVFKDGGYQLFIVGFDISRSKAVELIKARGDTPTVKEERSYVLLDDHALHIKRFRKLYRPDILLTDDTLFDHARVLQAIGQRLADLQNS